jgi:hypothetical protein
MPRDVEGQMTCTTFKRALWALHFKRPTKRHRFWNSGQHTATREGASLRSCSIVLCPVTISAEARSLTAACQSETIHFIAFRASPPLPPSTSAELDIRGKTTQLSADLKSH